MHYYKKSQLILLKGVLTFSVLDVISVKMEMSLISEKNIKSQISYIAETVLLYDFICFSQDYHLSQHHDY